MAGRSTRNNTANNTNPPNETADEVARQLNTTLPNLLTQLVQAHEGNRENQREATPSCISKHSNLLVPRNFLEQKGAVSMANRLTTDGIKDGIFKKKENAGNKKRRCNQVGHFTRYCTSRVVNERPRPTCYECGDPNHFERNCPRMNQATIAGGNHPNPMLAIKGNPNPLNNRNRAQGRAFTLGVAEAPQDSNIVTGTFSLNDYFATVLFDSGADFSFISTNFLPLIDIKPSVINPGYEIEIASGVNFDVIIGMDWLSKLRAKIVCFEKIVQIPLPNGDILEVHGERPEGNLKQLKTMKVNESKLEDILLNKRQNYEDDNENDPDEKFKSKNLNAERKRREKLKNRMLELRSVLNKEMIIIDAIDYIKELKISVEDLTREIYAMEEEMANEQSFEIIQIRPEEKMKKWGIESEVVVTHIDENKLWVKIVFEKKLGGFTKLIEALSMLGIELVDISVTTMKGAVLVTSCIVGMNGRVLVATQLRWPPKVTLGRLLPHARGLGFKPRHGGFPSGAKKEWGLSPKAKVRVLHTAQLDVTISLCCYMSKMGVLHVFSPGDDLIAYLNKAMAFLTAVASSRVTVQQVQGDKVKIILVLRIRAMLQVQGEILQVYRQELLNATTAKTEDLDTYDSDCDDLSNAQAVLMANISNYGSDVISEVEVPSELPKVSLVNESLKNLKFQLAQFDSVVKKITTPNALTEDIPSSSSLVMTGTVRFRNDQIARIMRYGDYQLGNVVISRVYYVEGLGHNLFSIGQFCDADLEVAFRKNTCFIRNLEGVDLLSGFRDTNLYTISLDDMIKSYLICLLSKASKTKSWLWHRRLSHLNFDIGIFVGYAPAKKEFRIYNRRTQIISKTIHVTFDELTAMAAKQSSSGPGLHFMTHATPSTGLVSIPVSQQPSAAPRAEVLADSPVSISISQDDPSTSIPSSQEQEHSLIISQGFKELPKKPTFHDDPLNESPQDSTSQGSSSNVIQIHTLFEHLGRWTKDHLIANVIGNPSFSVSTRKQLETDAMWCYFNAFLTSVEPKNFKQAMIKPSWIDKMQEEIHEFERLKV
nr:transcription factor DYT1 [Tanacetum cinerariifolium]